jgi:hypothetical protein
VFVCVDECEVEQEEERRGSAVVFMRAKCRVSRRIAQSSILRYVIQILAVTTQRPHPLVPLSFPLAMMSYAAPPS